MLKSVNKPMAFLVVALALTSTSIASAAETIRIALAGPVTGPVAQYGNMQFIGANMAIEQINRAGGVNGKMLEAVVYNDACDGKQAVAVAHRIVNDDIRFVVGHLCSSATLPAAAVYEDNGVLMITPASTHPDITARGYQQVFRTMGLDSMQGPAAAEYIIHSVKPQTMAVIHDQYPYGKGLAASIRAGVEKAGIKVALYEAVVAGDKDFSALIARLKRENVDFVYYGGFHPELGLLLRQSAKSGLDIQFMGPESVGNRDISAIAGEASEGLLVTLPRRFDQDPANSRLVAAFKARGDDPSGPFIFPAYSAVQVMAEGMKLTASEDPGKVAESLRANNFKTVTGDLDFDGKGDLKDFSFTVYQWHSDGSKTALTDQKKAAGATGTVKPDLPPWQ